jgi:hypothetical protein
MPNLLRITLSLFVISIFFLLTMQRTIAVGCQIDFGLPGVGGAGGPTDTNGGNGSAGECGISSAGSGGGGGGGGGGTGGVGGTGAGGGVLLKSTTGNITISGTITSTGGDSSTANGGTVKVFSASGCGSTSNITAGRIYPAASNCPPSAPTLNYPVNSSNGTTVFTVFKLRSNDAESDYLKYWIDVCSDSTCISVIRSICQINTGTGVPGTCTPSQTGWAGQDTQSATAYISSDTLTLSTIATLNYQPPLLSANTQYWWRAYAIDPGGSNTWSSASTINTFTTAPTETHIQGNVNIRGGVHFGS